MTAHYSLAPDRGVLRIAGPDARSFLQGIVTADVERASEARAIWSAFLTPQGKYLHDFFLLERGEALLLEMAAERREDLARRLKPYKLRAKVEIVPADDDWVVALLWGDEVATRLGLPTEAGAAGPLGGGLAFFDPRLPEAGARALLPGGEAEAILAEAGFQEAPRADWEEQRIALGLPDGGRDMEVEKAILLENGFDELGGVDWRKGCFLGQELTARTKYRGLVKKRLLPLRFEGPAPEAGAPVIREGKTVGDIRSVGQNHALALLRLEALDGPLQSGDTALTPAHPAWLRLQAEEKA
ncbi:CAF17-like 4Fe-4S cluster assembly/insertion protein YgfZ [Aquibaculum arenosum]|uniref:Folate-binding protein n=1 Tax=Aquibaculum arenosum TaxID=3032591 RepID=A0ABT5YQN9_9PROT|nr:folate-binding protein [Fodinicurvata sp. CAU 1616]MDF2097291.1 folate-binding protein [Fodinicurvata sp. CAU 1616]